MITIIELILTESSKGIGRVFLNMLLYWSLILVFVAGYERVKRDRANFGFKVFDVFTEWKGTWLVSIFFGLVISVITLGVGIVFTYETIYLLSIVVILLSLTYKFSLLSASYTVGITYLLLLILPNILNQTPYAGSHLFSNTNFTGLTILLGLFLVYESILLWRTKRNETYPNLVISNRGVLIGSHDVKKMSLIPFFVLIPSGMITPFASFWPYFSLGGESYSLLLVPFIVGFSHSITGSLPREPAVKLAKSILLLAFIVLLLAAGSIYISWLSLIAVIVAILGREFINYMFRTNDKQKRPYFTEMHQGLKVLGVIPGSPADRLDILVGEVITKVNGRPVNNTDQFYESLRQSGAFIKLDVVDDNGEVRFINNAVYEEDHHELGIIFITDRYRNRQVIKHVKRN